MNIAATDRYQANFRRFADQRRQAAPLRLYDLQQLVRRLAPQTETALIGYPAILDFISTLHVGRYNGRRLTPKTLRRWSDRHDFPLLRGKGSRFPPWTTTTLVTCWMVAYWLTLKDHRYEGPSLLRQTPFQYTDGKQNHPRSSRRGSPARDPDHD